MSAYRVLPHALAAAALAGCEAAPFDYHSDREIPRGPGAFSGEEGAFVLRAKLPGARESGEMQEYREFRRRNEAGETPEQREFREFQEWRDWRDWREWREWKKRQRN